MRSSGPGPHSAITALGVLVDARDLLLLVLCVPIAVFILGAPFALVARLVLELVERL